MKKLASLLLSLLMLFLLAMPVFSASDEPVIVFQPQQPYYPEYSVASYRVKATGSNLTATWFLEYQGKTYNLSDNTNGIEPWEGYAGESYGGAIEAPGEFVYFFSGIEEELSGSYIWCVIEDGHYSVTSQKALITVGNFESPPVIEDIPAQLAVEVDDLAEIRCVALAPGESQLEFLWYETPTGRLEDMRAVNRGTETSDFLTLDSSAVGTNYYICQVTSSEGGITYSSAVKFTVSEKAVMVYPPVIATGTIPEATAGQPYHCKLSCSDADAEFFIYYNPGKANDFEKTGLKLSSDGTLSGVPTAVGNFTFWVCASGAGGEDYISYTLRVKEAPAVPSEPTTPGVAPTVPAPTLPAATTPATENLQNPPQDPEGFPWLILVVVCIVSAGIGVGAALLILRKK